MATRNAILSVQVLVDASKAASGVDQATSKFDRFRGSMAKLAVPAAAVGAAVVAGAKQAVDSASRLQQSVGGVGAVFGKNAGQISQWAKGAADSVGLAESEYNEFAAVLGSQLKNAGQPMEKVAGQTDALITLGADLAATYGGTTTDAVNALSSALKGEFDPMEKYGASLSASAVSAQMAADGTDKLTGKQATAAKQQALLKLITQQTTDAQGMYASELDTVAGQQQRAAAQAENAKAALGQALLPAITAVTTKFAEFATWVQQNTTLVTVIVGVLATLAAGILAVNVALRAYTAAQTIATVAAKVFNAVMKMNPVGIVITAIMLLIGALVLLWNKNKGFRDFVLGMWKAIKNAAVASWNAIKTAAGAVWNWITNLIKGAVATWNAIINAFKRIVTGVWNAIKSAAGAVWNWIGNIIRTYILGWKILIQAFRTVVIAVWNAIKRSASAVWNAIKAVVARVIGSIRSLVTGVRTTVVNVWNAIKRSATTVFNAVKTVAKTALEAILKPVDLIKAGFDGLVGMIQSVVDWIGRIRFPEPPAWMKSIGSGISNIFSRSAPAPAPAARTVAGASSPALPARGMAGASSYTARRSSTGELDVIGAAGGGISIVVNGALDPDAVARQIQRLLRDRGRRTGAPVAGGTAAVV